MSQQGGNLPMDVLGSSSSGGAGSVGTAGSGSGSLAHAGGNNNNGGLKSARPTAAFDAREGDKGEGKDELAGGQGARDNAAGDSSGIAGSNSKSIKSSSDGGDIQDHVVKDAPTPAADDGGSGSGNGKGKCVEVVGDHALHIWTERDRKKKMKSVYSSLHSLLPRLPPKADKANIVGESVDYIKALEGTLQGLERMKLERREDALNYCSVPALAVRHLHHRCAMAAHQQTWCTPNIEVRMIGNESFIGVSSPRQPGVVTKALCVLEKYLIDVVELKIISCDQNRIMFFIHTCINTASTEITAGMMTVEDRYNLFMLELMQYIAK